MAVEIKELIIRAVAIDDVDGDQKVDSSEVLTEEMTSQIVQTCVKEVMKIIERKSSR